MKIFAKLYDPIVKSSLWNKVILPEDDMIGGVTRPMFDALMSLANSGMVDSCSLVDISTENEVKFFRIDKPSEILSLPKDFRTNIVCLEYSDENSITAVTRSYDISTQLPVGQVGMGDFKKKFASRTDLFLWFVITDRVDGKALVPANNYGLYKAVKNPKNLYEFLKQYMSNSLLDSDTLKAMLAFGRQANRHGHKRIKMINSSEVYQFRKKYPLQSRRFVLFKTSKNHPKILGLRVHPESGTLYDASLPEGLLIGKLHMHPHYKAPRITTRRPIEEADQPMNRFFRTITLRDGNRVNFQEITLDNIGTWFANNNNNG